jgi:hypothetical protein
MLQDDLGGSTVFQLCLKDSRTIQEDVRVSGRLKESGGN